MLTLKRTRGKSIYSLRGERVHGPRPKWLRAGRAGSSRLGRKFRAPEVPGKVRPKPKVGASEAGLASGGRRVRAGQKFRWPEGPGQVPGRLRAKQRVGMPGLVDVEGGRKLRVGRTFRGPEVPGCPEI